MRMKQDAVMLVKSVGIRGVIRTRHVTSVDIVYGCGRQISRRTDGTSCADYRRADYKSALTY